MEFDQQKEEERIWKNYYNRVENKKERRARRDRGIEMGVWEFMYSLLWVVFFFPSAKEISVGSN